MIKRFFVRLAIRVLLLSVLATLGPHHFCSADDLLQAKGELQWYRGNMHTHSLWSDGDDYLEMIALWYRDHDYQFLVFTDHNVLANTERWINVADSKGGQEAYEKLKARFPDWIQERTKTVQENRTKAQEQSTAKKKAAERLEVRLKTFDEVSKKLNAPGKFLLVQGEEISDKAEGLPIHLNVSNLEELISPMQGRTVHETIQNNVRAVLAQRKRTGKPMIVHLNHPNFQYGIRAEDLMRVAGEQFFEVYNGHPAMHNSGDDQHASTDRLWDIILTWRLAELQLPILYGLAVDDAHNYHHIPSRESEPGRGWVMVLANQLTAESLIESLETGRFYASSGVTLRRVETSAKEISVEVEPIAGETYTIEFIGTRQGFDTTSQPVTDAKGNEVRTTRHYSSDIGETLSTVHAPQATYRFQGDEIYVRAQITSSASHPNPSEHDDPQRAWCQPVVGPAVEQPDKASK